MGLLAEDLLDHLLDGRHARLAADQHDLVDLARASSPASLRRLLHRTLGALDQVADQLLQLGARSACSDRCFGPLASAVMNGRLTSVLCVELELDLGLLGGFLQALQRHAVLAQVDALVLA